MLLDSLGSLLGFLAAYPQHHARGSALYEFTDAITRRAFRDAQPAFESGQPVRLAELGEIVLPYEKMGAVDSIDLFGLDELLMFAFYHRNRGRYRRAADIGANIGLHSIVLARCGMQIEAYEPDPVHLAKIERNLRLNGVVDCKVHKAAVSDKRGTMTFVRVLGNTTSSHLAGAKAGAYGALERFEVEARDVREIAARVDFMKIDAEGHEAVILNAIPAEQWLRLDAFVEIGTPQNAEAVFRSFADSSAHIFSQKTGWSRVERLEQMPTTYKEGGVFISAKPAMPW